MSEPSATVMVTLRIPGQWQHPAELAERLPDGYQLAEDGLALPDGSRVGFGGVAPDDQFAEVFRSACRQPPSADELATVDAYTVNVILHGPGGSLDAARQMMRATAAIIRAGGAGVFIDNSAMAHGGTNWIEMAEDGGPDAISFAFVSIIRGKSDMWTMGMHVLGQRDIVMKRSDVEADGFDIVDVIRYLAADEKRVGDGHLIADLDGPRFRTVDQDDTEGPKGSPMYNPFGRLRLVSLRDIAEAN
jgi:hypothetical protein